MLEKMKSIVVEQTSALTRVPAIVAGTHETLIPELAFNALFRTHHWREHERVPQDSDGV